MHIELKTHTRLEDLKKFLAGNAEGAVLVPDRKQAYEHFGRVLRRFSYFRRSALSGWEIRHDHSPRALRIGHSSSSLPDSEFVTSIHFRWCHWRRWCCRAGQGNGATGAVTRQHFVH